MSINNGIPAINGVVYGWADIKCVIAGVIPAGITAIDYSDDQEVVNIYGAGRYPVGRGKGRITSTAKITLSMEEVLGIQAKATNGRLQDVDAFDIEVVYTPESGAIVVDKIRNCSFKKNERKWKEGDTNGTVELELIVSHIEWHKDAV